MAIQIIRDVVADVVKRGATRAVYAKQHDINSRFLNVRIQEDGKDIVVDSTSTVMLNVERPDQEENMFYGTVNSDGTVRVPLTLWMLELPGTLICDISVTAKVLVGTDEHKIRLTTMSFNVYVEETVVTDADIVETEEYSVIVDLLERTTVAEQKASQAASDAERLRIQCEDATEAAKVAASTANEMMKTLHDTNVSIISEELAKRMQANPAFVKDVSECADEDKLYVLPDGNIWAYTNGLVEDKVNQYKSNTAKFNYRLHIAYIGTADDPWRTGKGWVYVEINGINLTGKTSYIIRISGVEIVRHSFGATGSVSFFNQPASTAFDLTGHTKSSYFDIQGSLLLHQDDEGYYFDLMEANPAADTVRCIFGITLADNVNVSNANCANLFIEAVPLTTYTKEYGWRDTGLAYANYKITDADINNIAEKVSEKIHYVITDDDTTNIAEKVSKKINRVMYVDGGAGNDSNTGGQDSPLKTIQKAIDSGAKTIYCKAGTYPESITLNNVHGVKIIGQWEDYVSGKRPKVRIDHSTLLTPSDNGNGLKTVALPVDTYKYVHPLLYQVFVTKTLSPTVGSGITIGYVVSLWNVTDEQVSTHYKLVPVMTLDECRSTEETFFYDGATLYIHSTGSTFRMVSSNKRNKVENCSNVVFEDIAFDYCYNDALAVNNSNGIIFRNCEFSHSSTACGVATNNMNGEFYNCEAYCNRIDGFNFHKFGETTVYNCIGAYNYDDGISHHDGCTGSIHGGQYHHNGKGGVASPTYGAAIDIYNVISNNNLYGIYAISGPADRQIIVNGCYIHHNTYGITSPKYELLVINSIITDNSTNTGGKVTVI